MQISLLLQKARKFPSDFRIKSFYPYGPETAENVLVRSRIYYTGTSYINIFNKITNLNFVIQFDYS